QWLQGYTRYNNLRTYTQSTLNISTRQTSDASCVSSTKHLDYGVVKTFTPHEATPNLHQRGYQTYAQHRYVTNSSNLLTSQLSFRRFDADVLPNSDAPYELLVETTEGGFFNRQHRETSRVEWQEIFQLRPHQFHGSHELKAGIIFADS